MTGIACPDCPGVLALSAGDAHLRFRCRIGHVYSLLDLIQSKEHRIEAELWAPITTFDELAHLLREAAALGHASADADAYEQRAARVLQLAGELRRIVEANQPIAVSPPTAATAVP